MLTRNGQRIVDYLNQGVTRPRSDEGIFNVTNYSL